MKRASRFKFAQPPDDDVPPGHQDEPSVSFEDHVEIQRLAELTADPTDYPTSDAVFHYGASDALPTLLQRNFDPLWWSLAEAADYLASETHDPDGRGTSSTIPGLARLEEAIRSGKIPAYGSIDASPVNMISAPAWTEFNLIASNVLRSHDGQVYFDIFVRSNRSYRAGALNDHCWPSGDTVPSADFPKGEPGYYRVVSNVFVKESDIRHEFPSTRPNSEREKRKSRGIGVTQIRLIATLESKTFKGKKRFPEKGKVSFPELARWVKQLWDEEDLEGKPDADSPHTEDKLDQALRRLYKRTIAGTHSDK